MSETAHSQAAFDAVRAVFAEARAEDIDPPFLLPASILLDLSGEAMRQRLLMIADTPGPTMCLRTEFTVPVCRAYLARDGRSARAYRYDGVAFRAAPADGSPQQIPQIGLERFRDPDPLTAEAETFALAIRAAQAAGAGGGVLHLGASGLFAVLLDAFGLPEPWGAKLKRNYARPRAFKAVLHAAAAPATAAVSPLGAALRGLSPDQAEAALDELMALSGVTPVGGRSVAAIAARLTEQAFEVDAPRLAAEDVETINALVSLEGAPEPTLKALQARAPETPAVAQAFETWRRRLAAFDAAGLALDRARFSLGYGRHFTYYDGAFFEYRVAELGSEAIVAAGGRYDGLASRLGAAEPAPAVGAMVRPDRAAKAAACRALARETRP
ncbi:MAG: ATP phosphoribosyltransferase regulatory subunit [Maricaulaceae bacterium]